MKRILQAKKTAVGTFFFFASAVLSLSDTAQADCNGPSCPRVRAVGGSEIEQQAVDALTYGGRDDRKTEEEWALENRGYRNTLILFDPTPSQRSKGRKRVYPQLSRLHHYSRVEDGKVVDYDTPTFNTIDLSVDDEINKTRMAIFTPMEKVQWDFSESVGLRNTYLNMFKTVRGIANATLAYLDKTVAAALATTANQADMAALQEVQRQVSENTSRLANPQRSQLYVDHDEKFEFCMNDYKGSDHVAHEGGAYRSWCENTCGPGRPSGPLSGYYKCLCCAENYGKVTTPFGGDAHHCQEAGPDGQISTAQGWWSLTQRTFQGLKNPAVLACLITEHGSTPICDAETKAALKNYEEQFRWLYGDICFLPGTEELSNGSSGGSYGYNKAARTHPQNYKAPQFRFKYIAPMWSPSQAVDLLRNGPMDDPCANIMFCPQTQSVLKVGICPAFRKLVELYDKNEIDNPTDPKDRANLNTYWMEASLGQPITRSDLRDLRDAYRQSGNDKERWIENFCDASAIGAYRKLHARMQSIALDHLLASRTATNEDKNQLREMIGRVTSYLVLADQDRATAADSLIVGIKTQASKFRETLRSMNATAASDQVVDQFQKTSIGSPGQ